MRNTHCQKVANTNSSRDLTFESKVDAVRINNAENKQHTGRSHRGKQQGYNLLLPVSTIQVFFRKQVRSLGWGSKGTARALSGDTNYGHKYTENPGNGNGEGGVEC